MALKNYTSEVPASRSISEIQQILIDNGVRKILLHSDNEGLVIGIHFMLQLQSGEISIQLPARVKNVAAILRKQSAHSRYIPSNEKKILAQAYRTAWRNIRDWVAAQMALVQIDMAKVEEVFLPYVVMHEGKTLYEQMSDNGFKQLSSGKGQS